MSGPDGGPIPIAAVVANVQMALGMRPVDGGDTIMLLPERNGSETGQRGMTFIRDHALEDEHEEWLRSFHPQHLRNWQKLRGSDSERPRGSDVEAATSEAAVRRWLVSEGLIVEPNESLANGPGTDFRCARESSAFCVEVTCITIDTATKHTRLPHAHDKDPVCRCIDSLTGVINRKVSVKASRCADRAEATLVAVTTFHSGADEFFSDINLDEVLTGARSYIQRVNRRANVPGPSFMATSLRSSSFSRLGDSLELEHIRRSVSGLLLFGLHSKPPRVHGVLHMSSVRPFDHALLPQVRFRQLCIEDEGRAVSVERL